MKRIVILTLTAALLLSVLFTGCAQQASNTETTNTESTVANNSETEASSETEPQVTKIKVATQGMPLPFVYVDENNELQGYDIQVLKAVFDKLPQYELEFEVTDIASVFTGLSSGNYQLGVGNFGYNEERAQSYLYSYPYNEVINVFCTKAGEEIHTLEEAAGRTTEASTGSSVANFVEAYNESHPDKKINIKYAESSQTILQNAVMGNVDFLIMDKASFYAYSAMFPLEMVATELSEEDNKLVSENTYTYFILPKTEEGEALREDINAVLKELHADGTLTRLSESIFGWDQSPSADAYETPIN